MYGKAITLLCFMAASLATSTPTINKRAAASAVPILEAIAPNAKSCSGAQSGDECRTAIQASEFLITAFTKYEIYNPAEMAAVLSLIAFESGDFKYNTNHFPAPGRPGQGTRNMQMPSFNLEYALEVAPDALKKVTTTTTVDGLAADKLNAIRDIVTTDEFTWASGAWFYSKKCDAGVKTAVQTGGKSGYEKYLGCIGTTVTDDRLAYWTRARTAFGLPTS